MLNLEEKINLAVLIACSESKSCTKHATHCVQLLIKLWAEEVAHVSPNFRNTVLWPQPAKHEWWPSMMHCLMMFDDVWATSCGIEFLPRAFEDIHVNPALCLSTLVPRQKSGYSVFLDRYHKKTVLNKIPTESSSILWQWNCNPIFYSQSMTVIGLRGGSSCTYTMDIHTWSIGTWATSLMVENLMVRSCDSLLNTNYT